MDRRTAIALLGSAALALPSKSVFAQPLVSPDQADRASLYHDIWVSAISEASLRSEPSTNAERFAFVREGFPLKVLEYDDSWLYVLNPRTQGTAYISQSLVQPADTPSKFVTRDMPKLDDEFQDTLIASDDSTLFWY